MKIRVRSVTALGIPAALMLVALDAGLAAAVSLVLRDVVDPVPPGGELVYTIRVNPNDPDTNDDVVTGCFNPPPECITFQAECDLGTVACVGNSFTGFFCQNAINEGVSCGVGDPPVPDFTLCIPKTEGVCKGGLNDGQVCTSDDQCPGFTFYCVRAFNEGAFCGTGNPLQPNSQLCVPNLEGICASGANFGEPCVTDFDCTASGEPPTDITVTLPVPAGTIFANADNGGVSDGSTVTWTLPPLQPCGIPETPQCPLLTVTLAVNSNVAVGTVIEAQATGVDETGTRLSNQVQTLVGTFRLSRFRITYARRDGRDRLTYGAFFTLDPGATIDPPSEAFQLTIADGAATTIADFPLPAGTLVPASSTTFTAATDALGIRKLLIRSVAPQHYFVTLRARNLELPSFGVLEANITLTIGDDVLTHTIPVFARRKGRAVVSR
jgi:hypothetical protein